jgi:hypothetical protein
MHLIHLLSWSRLSVAWSSPVDHWLTGVLTLVMVILIITMSSWLEVDYSQVVWAWDEDMQSMILSRGLSVV